MKNKKILVIGGDMRQVYLVNMLKKHNDVNVYGLSHQLINKDVKEIESVLEISNYDYVIGPVPLSRNGETVVTNLSKKEIYISDIFRNMKTNSKFFGAKLTDKVRELANKFNIEIEDILKRDEFAIMNAIATAEGAIKTAIENSVLNIHGSRILVVGYGRCGKILANKLKNLNARVTVASRKNEKIALIRAFGMRGLMLNKLDRYLGEFDFIFNTAPVMIFDKNKLLKIKERAILVDISSRPGGVDFEVAKDLKVSTFQDLGIPGKISPYSSAKIIYDILESLTKNLEGLE